MSNSTFCALPWNHLATHPQGQASLCCRVDFKNSIGMAFSTNPEGQRDFHNLNKDKISDIINSESFKKTRLQMLNNEKPIACMGCFKDEDLGMVSKRVRENKNFETDIQVLRKLTNEDGSIKSDIIYAELRLGNFCNLKCRTCNPNSSSKWKSDYGLLQDKFEIVRTYDLDIDASWSENLDFWEDFFENTKNLKQLFINGGEPTLIKQHWVFLRKLIHSGRSDQIDIRYNINMTFLPADAFDIWKQFKSVFVGASIDDLGARNGYLRSGAKWADIVQNIFKIRNAGIPMAIEQTVSAYNVFYLDEMENFCRENDVVYGLNFVTDPEYLSLSVIPNEIKKTILSKLEINGFSKRWLFDVGAHLATEHRPEHWEQFKKYNRFLDLIRNEKFPTQFVDFNNLLKSVGYDFDSDRLPTKASDEKKKWIPYKKNKSLCVVPWSHTFISPQSERRMCCASREKSTFVQQYIDQPGESGVKYKPSTLDEHWNSPNMREVRLKMLRGEILSECEVCQDQVLNLSTYKDWFNKALFPELLPQLNEITDEQGFTDVKPISYDYRIHNTCNFKCRMCGEQLSSSWELEKRKHNEWSPNRAPWMIPEISKKIQIFQETVVEAELELAIEEKRIKEIYWVGGEPLVWDLHWKLMQRMINIGISKQVFCRYNTNLSHIHHKGISLAQDLLPHFKGYLICASIDGADEIGEWIRTGLDWEKFLINFKEIQNGPAGKNSIALDVTLTLPGLFGMKRMFDLALELDTEVITKIIFAFDPEIVLSPLALPRKILDEILDDLINYVEPRVTLKTRSLLDTFYDLKKRPTFAELYPDRYLKSFKRGREYQNKIAMRRADGELNKAISLNDIYKANTAVYNWWNQNIIDEKNL